MTVRNSTVLVTGANRGLGRAFAAAALERGANKVYAAVRDPKADVPAGTTKVILDVTDPNQIARIEKELSDVTLVVQNAGILELGSPLDAQGEESLRRLLETNFWGVLRVSRAISPILARHRGAMINVVSVGSWTTFAAVANYAISKAALWGLTNNLRQVFEPLGVSVMALHMGYVDTDMVRKFEAPKLSVAEVVAAAYDGLEAGHREVLVDKFARNVKAGLSTEKAAYLAIPEQ